MAVAVRGRDLEDLFENGALALFSLLADTVQVRDSTSLDVEVRSPDLESLLVDWLNELLFLFESERRLFCRFRVLELGEGYLRARVWGESIDRSRHRIRAGVKAVTYHDLEIQQTAEGCVARMVFDV